MLDFPAVLGVQWNYSYDTEWWLGVFEDEAQPGRHLGVELSLLHAGTPEDCSPTAGLAVLFVGISDTATGKYTQSSIIYLLNETQAVTSTAVPYNVSVRGVGVGGSAGGGASGSAGATGVRAGVEQGSAGPNSQRVYAHNVPNWTSAFDLEVATTPALQNVHMAADGFLKDVLVYFMQVAQPDLAGTATITKDGETIRGKGSVWLQHIWGTFPKLARPAASASGGTGAGAGAGTGTRAAHAARAAAAMAASGGGATAPAAPLFALVWTWQCVKLDNGMALSLTQFADTAAAPGASVAPGVAPGAAPAAPAASLLHYLNVVNMTTGESHEYTGTEFSIALSDLWVSPVTGHSYARRSDVRVPAIALNLTWHTLVADNEHFVPGLITYYEAASLVTGTVGGVAVSGTGFLEHKVPTSPRK